MSCDKAITHPLKREGTVQAERFPHALEENYFKVEERDINKLLSQSARYAEFVHFYNDLNIESGNWKAFFDEIFDYNNNKLRFNSIEELKEKSETSPHLALFISFLHLLGFVGDEINTFTKKHLDFYYETILNFQKEPAKPDKLVLTFEPAKGVSQTFVPSGTEFDAGKDGSGKPLIYKTEGDLIVNQAKIGEIKTIFSKKTDEKVEAIFASTDAPAENKPSGNSIGWKTFGSSANKPVTIGFAVASAILNLPEGNRRISFLIDGIATIDRRALVVEYSSPEGWTVAELDDGSFYPGDSYFKNVLLVKIEPGLAPVVPYSEKIHQGNMHTKHPVVKFTLKQGNTAFFKNAYAALSLIQPKKIELTVQVNGVKNILLQSDMGLIDNTKPFMPFGPDPQKSKSILYVGKPEIFNKYLTAFNLAISWKGLPGNISKYYSSWAEGLNLLFDKTTSETLRKELIKRYFDIGQFDKFEAGHPPGKVSILDGGKWKYLQLNRKAGFSSKIFYDEYRKRHLTNADTRNVYKTDGSSLSSDFQYETIKGYSHENKFGFIKLELDYEFGQDIYSKLLTAVMIEKAVGPNKGIEIPEKPYIPIFNHLHIDYTSQTTVNFSDQNEQLFQIYPFGANEIKSAGKTLIPQYSEEGNLFIGIKEVIQPVGLSLYFRIESNSGNLDKILPAEQKVEWFYLKDNEWIAFENGQIPTDTTSGLQSSGIIRYSIPQEAITPHGILTDKLVWLAAKVKNYSDYYPHLIGIVAQAVTAKFDNRNNLPDHLEFGLPSGTITKPKSKLDGISKIIQPDISFDGKPEEKQKLFYTRVSERLRHKNRAWSIWDYERLVLNNFNEIYKVKCIPHSNAECEYVPGSTLLVPVPNVSKIKQSDILAPRVPEKTLISMKNLISTLKPEFAEVNVCHPVYIKAEVTTTVTLKSGFIDKMFYTNLLNEELKTLFAPWIKAASLQPEFRNAIYISHIINFIEELNYIDHVFGTTVRLQKPDGNWITCSNSICTSKETEIITSVEHHQITIIE